MINGYLISVLGLAMLVPAFSDMYWTSASWSHFFKFVNNLFVYRFVAVFGQ